MVDPSVREFVEASDEDSAEQCLVTLLEHRARPIVTAILGRKLRSFGLAETTSGLNAELEDMVSDTLVALLGKLRSLRQRPIAQSIGSFDDYAATVAFHTFALYLRRRHPGRSRLKNRLRYALGRSRGLAVWATDAGTVCGRAAARGQPIDAAATARLEACAAADAPWRHRPRRLGVESDRAVDTAETIVRAVGGPVEFDRLVAIVAALCPEAVAPLDLGGAAQANDGAEDSIDRRRAATRLWQEIGALPLRQRVALLLNLRSQGGESVLWVLPLIGVASIRAIARTLSIADLEMAALWKQLPLDDLAIAERLDCTRQQVINLRSAARKRLANRLAHFDGTTGGNIGGVLPSLESSR